MRDIRGPPAALSSDPHDHNGRPARWRAADAGDRRWLRASPAARLCDGRRPRIEPASDLAHHTDHLSLSRPAGKSAGLVPQMNALTLLPASLFASLGDAAAPFARTACSSAAATAPSPIAAPTRLTDPDRTSPEANTLRTLVSSGSGWPNPLFDRRASGGISEPVNTKFLVSKATPLSLSQAVAGSPPIKRKTWRSGFFV